MFTPKPGDFITTSTLVAEGEVEERIAKNEISLIKSALASLGYELVTVGNAVQREEDTNGHSTKTYRVETFARLVPVNASYEGTRQ